MAPCCLQSYLLEPGHDLFKNAISLPSSFTFIILTITIFIRLSYINSVCYVICPISPIFGHRHISMQLYHCLRYISVIYKQAVDSQFQLAIGISSYPLWSMGYVRHWCVKCGNPYLLIDPKEKLWEQVSLKSRDLNI